MKDIEKKYLPKTSPGTCRSLEIIRYIGKKAGPKVYLQAGLHADEAPGYVVLFLLRRMLDEADAQGCINGEIVVVPAANPIGLSQWRDEYLHGRFDFFNAINFNRQHLDMLDAITGKIKGRLTSSPSRNIDLIRDVTSRILTALEPEDEAAALKHILFTLSHDADIVLDLHCDYEAVLHLYLGTPLWPDGADLAAYLGAEATFLAVESGGFPFDEANSGIWWQLAKRFPAHPIPPACFSATVELRGIANTDVRQARQDARNIYAFLQNRGAIVGNPPPLPDLKNDATPLTGVDYIKATAPGIVSYAKKVGDTVDKGETVAEIMNPLAQNEEYRVTKIVAKTDGLLFSRNTDRLARPGRIIAKVAGKVPLREEGGQLLTL